MSSYWASFIYVFIICALFNGKAVIVTDSITVDLWMDIIEKHNVNAVLIVPVYAQLLLKSSKLRKLPSIRNVVVSGERFSRQILTGLASVLPNALIQCCYACTELVPITISGSEPTSGISSGYLSYNVNVKVSR